MREHMVVRVCVVDDFRKIIIILDLHLYSFE